MIPVAEAYTAAVHYHLNPFYANWEPSRPLEIGDHGTVANGSFQHLGTAERPAPDTSVDPGLFFADLTDERQLA